MIYTKLDLDQQRCRNGCQDHPVFLTGECHPEDPVWVAYDRASGMLCIICSTCETEVAKVMLETGLVMPSAATAQGGLKCQ